MQRRDNLRASAQDLESQLAAAQEGLNLALDELRKAELMATRDQDRERGTAAAGQRAHAPDLAARRPARSAAADRRSW